MAPSDVFDFNQQVDLTSSADTDPYASISDNVYNQIKRMIIHKQLVSGKKLLESSLSEQLSVSRTPVREALRRLANEGYVLIFPKSGAWVASPTKSEVEDAYIMRGKLESWAASMAVRKVSPLFLAKLDEKIQEEDRYFKEKNIEKYLNANTDFHMIIAEAAGNSVLSKYVRDMLAKTFIYMFFLKIDRYFDFGINPSMKPHSEIVAAFAKKDETLCVRLVEEHVEVALGDLRFE